MYSQLTPIPFGERLRDTVPGRLPRRPAIDVGRLLYGRPFIPETPLELRLGRQIGFAWNVSAYKR